MTKRNFGKDYKTPRELVTLLENRGLKLMIGKRLNCIWRALAIMGQRNNLRDFIFKHII